MKQLFLFISITALSLIALASCSKQTQLSFNFLSYNVKNGCGMDEQTDYQRIADLIISTDAEVVALQELDSVTERSNGTYVLGELARLTGMYATYAPAIDFSGGKYGIGILSKEKPLAYKAVPLPGREEARTLLAVEFADYRFGATHLSLTPEDQLLSVDLINQLNAATEKPVFLAGDMNSVPQDDTQKALAQQWTVLTDTTCCTFPADTPKICLDYIYVDKAHRNRLDIVKQTVIADSIASDHRPVHIIIKTKK